MIYVIKNSVFVFATHFTINQKVPHHASYLTTRSIHRTYCYCSFCNCLFLTYVFSDAFKGIMNMPNLAVQALALTIRHLKQFGLERILHLGASFRPYSSNVEMTLSANALQQLEVSLIFSQRIFSFFNIPTEICTVEHN